MSPLDRTLSALGRAGVAAGLLLLAFAAFQLWGTGLAEARAQEELEAGFDARIAGIQSGARAGPAGQVANTGTATGSEPAAVGGPDADDERLAEAAVIRGRSSAGARTGATTDAGAGPAPLAGEGEPVATLHIPAIGLRKTVVQGTSRDSLRSGPGHYRGTPLPGRPGNAAIAGHRTTHGAPFFDIDELQPGDEIDVETVEGRFTYVVEGHDDGAGGQLGHRIVAPEEVSVIADQGDDRLTLTACHPTYSARQRIVVTAVLDGFPVGGAPALTAAHLAVAPVPAATPTLAAPPAATDRGSDLSAAGTPAAGPVPASPGLAGEPTAEMAAAAAGLGWQTAHAGVTLRWAAATALIALAARIAASLWRRWPAYAVASPAFGLALFTCFTHLDRLLPAA